MYGGAANASGWTATEPFHTELRIQGAGAGATPLMLARHPPRTGKAILYAGEVRHEPSPKTGLRAASAWKVEMEYVTGRSGAHKESALAHSTCVGRRDKMCKPHTLVGVWPATRAGSKPHGKFSQWATA
jgi:hypothetical protein